jgi:hypothetical protein
MPTMLGSDPDEMRDRIDAQFKESEEATPDNPKLARDYVFAFKYESKSRVYEGKFKNKILNVGERMRCGALASELIGGKSYDSVPPIVKQLALITSWMTYSLDRKTRPDWATNLSAIEDENVLFALYAEVWDHQSTFLGLPDSAVAAAPEET